MFLYCPHLHEKVKGLSVSVKGLRHLGVSQSLSQEKKATGLNVFCTMAFKSTSLQHHLCTSETDAFFSLTI